MKTRYLLAALLSFFVSETLSAQSRYIDSLKLVLEKTPKDTHYVRVLHVLTSEFLEYDINIAGGYANEALKISRELRYDDGIAQAMTDLSDVCYYKGEYKIATDFLFQALKIYEKQQNPKGIASVENNLGAVYYAQSNLKEALKHYNNAILQYSKADDKVGIGRVKNNIGNLYFASEDYDNALVSYNESLLLKEETKDRNGIALTLNNLGNVYGSIGEYDKSRDHFIRSLKISDELGDRYTQSMTLNNIGLLYQLEGDSTEALHYVRRSLVVAYSIDAKDLVKDAYAAMAEIHEQFKNYQAAYEAYKKYSVVKDSLLNEESQNAIIEMQQRYNSEKQQQQIDAQNEIIDQKQRFSNLLIGVLVLILVFSVFLVKVIRDRSKANKLLSEQKTTIENKNEELSEKNKNITDSITYASRIQKAILPPEHLVKSQFPDSFVLYKPKDIVSGDFYWMEVIGNNTVFAVADCTGHGVPGAFMSIAGSNLLMEAVSVHGITNPALILNEANKNLGKMLHQDHYDSSVKDGMDISLCTFDREKKQLYFAGAFNPLWLIRNGEMQDFKGDKFPIGAYVSTFGESFTLHEIDVQKDDCIYIFSDGFADQFGGKNGKKLKDSNFKKMLIAVQHLSMEQQGQYIHTEFEKWRGDLEQLDDVCVIGIRF